MRNVYAGPKNPRTGEQIFAGFPPGSDILDAPSDGLAKFIDGGGDASGVPV